jgi:hypothetical protein
MQQHHRRAAAPSNVMDAYVTANGDNIVLEGLSEGQFSRLVASHVPNLHARHGPILDKRPLKSLSRSTSIVTTGHRFDGSRGLGEADRHGPLARAIVEGRFNRAPC